MAASPVSGTLSQTQLAVLEQIRALRASRPVQAAAPIQATAPAHAAVPISAKPPAAQALGPAVATTASAVPANRPRGSILNIVV